MISKFTGCTNEKIVVTCLLSTDCVVIRESYEQKREKLFAGFPLRDLYNDFSELFSENITFDEAVKFFSPNIGNYVVNR